MIAPRARPEPVLMLQSQKVLAIMYPKIAPSHKYQCPLSEYSFEKISAITSNIINNEIGNIQNIFSQKTAESSLKNFLLLLVFEKTFYFKLLNNLSLSSTTFSTASTACLENL